MAKGGEANGDEADGEHAGIFLFLVCRTRFAEEHRVLL